MSKTLTRTYSLRKPIRPIVDIEEDEDEQRRDHAGRKRVDVIHCLLDSSSDELDDGNFIREKLNSILWLTLDEIRHIRFVVTQTSRSSEKPMPAIRWGYPCFRCRKRINYFSFLPSFLRSANHECCFICQQMICRKCSVISFLPPASRLLIPVRIHTLIKPCAMMLEKKYEKSNPQTKTICYDCLQVRLAFNEHRSMRFLCRFLVKIFKFRVIQLCPFVEHFHCHPSLVKISMRLDTFVIVHR